MFCWFVYAVWYLPKCNVTKGVLVCICISRWSLILLAQQYNIKMYCLNKQKVSIGTQTKAIKHYCINKHLLRVSRELEKHVSFLCLSNEEKREKKLYFTRETIS